MFTSKQLVKVFRDEMSLDEKLSQTVEKLDQTNLSSNA